MGQNERIRKIFSQNIAGCLMEGIRSTSPSEVATGMGFYVKRDTKTAEVNGMQLMYEVESREKEQRDEIDISKACLNDLRFLSWIVQTQNFTYLINWIDVNDDTSTYAANEAKPENKRLKVRAKPNDSSNWYVTFSPYGESNTNVVSQSNLINWNNNEKTNSNHKASHFYSGFHNLAAFRDGKWSLQISRHFSQHFLKSTHNRYEMTYPISAIDKKIPLSNWRNSAISNLYVGPGVIENDLMINSFSFVTTNINGDSEKVFSDVDILGDDLGYLFYQSNGRCFEVADKQLANLIVQQQDGFWPTYQNGTLIPYPKKPIESIGKIPEGFLLDIVPKISTELERFENQLQDIIVS